MRVTLAALGVGGGCIFELDHLRSPPDRRGATASRPRARHRVDRRHRPRRRPRRRHSSGDLLLDTLAQRPLGSSAFALLLVAVGACLLVAWLGRIKLVAPVIAVFLFSFVYSIVLLGILGALSRAGPAHGPVGSVAARRRLRHRPRRDLRAARWSRSIERRRADGSDRTGEPGPAVRRRPSGSPRGDRSGFLTFALIVILARRRPRRPGSSTSRSSRAATSRPRRTTNRTVVQAIPSTRGLIYDRNGPAARRERRVVRGQDPAWPTCRSSRAGRGRGSGWRPC